MSIRGLIREVCPVTQVLGTPDGLPMAVLPITMLILIMVAQIV